MQVVAAWIFLPVLSRALVAESQPESGWEHTGVKWLAMAPSLDSGSGMPAADSA